MVAVKQEAQEMIQNLPDNCTYEDIESIATYIEKDSPAYASSVVSKFFEKAEILKDFTESVVMLQMNCKLLEIGTRV